MVDKVKTMFENDVRKSCEKRKIKMLVDNWSGSRNCTSFTLRVVYRHERTLRMLDERSERPLPVTSLVAIIGLLNADERKAIN